MRILSLSKGDSRTNATAGGPGRLFRGLVVHANLWRWKLLPIPACTGTDAPARSSAICAEGTAQSRGSP